MRKILGKEISKDEILRMRENGMTNTDIANAIGVSYATVYRWLGKQPPAPKVTRSYQPAIQDKEPRVPEPEAALVVENRQIKLSGLFASYNVHAREKMVDVILEGETTAFSIKLEDLDILIRELVAIQRKTDDIRVGNEAW